ncbi:S8 family serine peptidase [Sutcliffiella horikoshii]|uniref:S8 family serine peptidase n=1 Tax=Sutcliffiella horikoshii TaxID=79883 RepID=A0AA94WQ08_9BACI|nr:S8 family serine peptidase [Sutcliffiella horikoshii]TYS59980.1 S8 family serine peptidase [Sutcliffiella horikoshii]
MKKSLSFMLVMVLCLTPLIEKEVVHASQEENMRIIVKYKEKGNYSYSKVKPQIKNIKKKEFSKIKKELESQEEVEYVEEDSFFYYTSTTTNTDDPYYPYQKDYLQVMNVQEAWSGYQQSYKPVVAVLDSGIDLHHLDLKENIVKPYNVLSPSSMPVDEIGHGTHVAGIVGAKTNNGSGIVSIVKDTYIMPIKVGDRQGAFASDIASGVDYAIENGADIINISIAGPKQNNTLKEAIDKAVNSGVMIVAAGGNNSSDTVEYPAGYPGVVSVGASSLTGELADFSNFGDSVAVVAPGVEIFSTLPTSFSTSISGYGKMSGTSMAAPLVSSQAAMLKSTDRNLTGRQLKEIIEESSKNALDFPVRLGQVNAADSLQYYHGKNRISGKNSLETSVEVAKRGWDNVSSSTLTNGNRVLKGRFAILSSNKTFADSLSVIPLAYKINSPIFLSEKNYLPQVTISSMKEMDVDHVILVGGEQAISKSVEDKLKANDLKSTRISGKTRYDTAVEISKFVAKDNGEVMIVNGKSFPDALSASVEAAKRSMPIVFVEETWVPSATSDFLKMHYFTNKYIVGGTKPISDSVKKSLDATRISGADRYKTNIAVAEYFNSSYDGYYFATGADFKDALTGGLLAAKQGKALMLVRPSEIDSATKDYLEKSNHQEFGILGGRQAVHSNVLWEIDKILLGN